MSLAIRYPIGSIEFVKFLRHPSTMIFDDDLKELPPNPLCIHLNYIICKEKIYFFRVFFYFLKFTNQPLNILKELSSREISAKLGNIDVFCEKLCIGILQRVAIVTRRQSRANTRLKLLH